MASTPPPQQAAQTPATPLHGAKYDTYQPYHSPRKSTRSSVKRNLRFEQTPPPPTSNHNLRSSSSSTSPKFTRLNLSKSSSHTFSPPSSAQSSPKTKSRTNIGAGGRITRGREIASQSAHTITTTRDLPSCDEGGNISLSHSAVTTTAGMLPTPAKTPRKQPAKTAPAIKATARVLFPVHPAPAAEIAPSPKKRAKKGRRYNGFSLDSFTGEENDGEDGKIAIFTDSKDRVPELDESQDNPFYVKNDGSASTSQPSAATSSKRRKVSNGTKRTEKVEEALKRDDGMVYVFRGKKIFRKFVDDTDDWDESEITADNTSSRARPFTRSSIKPRLLFPTEEQRQMRNASADYVDEEATTEVEEQDEVVDSEMTDVEASTDKEVLITPVKETAEPASPPASGRATRGSTRKVSAPEPVEYLPTNTTRMKKASPFDSWQRSKAGRETKRKGEDGVEGSGGSASKKVKRTTA